MQLDKKYDVLILGAGVSGLVSAFFAARRGKSVCVLESQDIPARKVYATGNGRCNFSNKDAENSELVIKSMREDFGIEPTFEENRAYPRSFEAASFAEALVRAATNAGAEVFCNARGISVQKNEQGFVVECENKMRFLADKLILATGGKAGIQYGCTGDGYRLAQSLGHSIIKPIPALDGLTCKEGLDDLHGVRVNAKVILRQSADGQEFSEIASDTGEVQFTSHGISGICVMNLSRHVLLKDNKRFELVLDLFPEDSPEGLIEKVLQRKRDFGCGMSWLIPEKLKEYLHTRRPEDLKGPAGMAYAAKNLSFEITGTRGWKTAQTTRGGVPLSELSDSFESAVCPGLYITGELMDYDGPCGGFNINHAIYSGLMAGNDI